MKLRDRLYRLRERLLQKKTRYDSLVQFADPCKESGNDAVSILFLEHAGQPVTKWLHYLGVYDRYFSRYRGKPVRLLEIGVMHGGSLELWRKYLGPQAKIFGVDIDPKITSLPDVTIRIGSQTDAAFLRSVTAEMGGLDIVIDDGSHVASHQRASFEILFPLLSNGGLYIVEDLHTAYWPGEWEGGYRRRGTFIEEIKSLIDDIHFWHHQKQQRFQGTHLNVAAVHVYESMVVVEKDEVAKPRYTTRGTADPSLWPAKPVTLKRFHG